MRQILWWLVVSTLLAAPAARGEGFSGTWSLENGPLVVVLREDAAGALAGTVSRDGARFAVRGKTEAGVAKGIFHDDWTGTFFEARLTDAGQLEFVILESVPDQTEYQRHPHLLTRRPVAAVTAAGRLGRMEPHPAGFEMWVPDGWGAEASGGMLRLLPPTSTEALLGPSEVVLVMTVELGGAAGTPTPEDPRVLHFLDSMVLTVSGTLRREAAPTTLAAGARRGAFLEWITDTVAPTSRRCRAWVTVLDRSAVAVVASGPGLQLGARTGDLRLIFASLGLDAGTTRPALMRSWSFQSGLRFGPEPGWVTDWTGARSPADEACRITFAADGTYQRLRGEGAEPELGRWAAGDGALHLIRGDVREVYEYGIEREEDGMKLRLRSGERGEIWIRE